nr:DUF58 domain-containing protein [Pirellula staleyi]
MIVSSPPSPSRPKSQASSPEAIARHDQPTAADRLGGALTHDFCPWANRYVYWLKSPLALLSIVALVGLVIGLAVTPQGYWVFGTIVAVIALGIVWPRVAMAGVRASVRFLDQRGSEGAPSRALLSIHNRYPWPVWGLRLERGFYPRDTSEMETELLDSSKPKSELVFALACVPGWSSADFEWQFVPERRGLYPLSMPIVATSFPLGLWERSQRVEVLSQLLVSPRVVALDALPASDGHRWSLGALSDRRSGTEGDIVGTRPLRPGDSLRHVHWPQTARYGRLILSERQAVQSAVVRVVVDLAAQHHTGLGDHSTLEQSLRVAASVCHSLLAHDLNVQLVLGKRRTDLASGKRARDQLADLLATLQVDDPESETFARELAQQQPSTQLCVGISTTLGAADNSARLKPKPGQFESRGQGCLLIAPGITTFEERQRLRQQHGAWCVIAADRSALDDFIPEWQEVCRDVWCGRQ